MSDSLPGKVLVVVPVFNDWAGAGRLLGQLDRVFCDIHQQARVLLVDDGSSEPRPDVSTLRPLSAVEEVEILRLRHNLGHQRAIAIGLAYVHASIHHELVIVMDGDGQDRPEDVPHLIEAVLRGGGRHIVFAARTRRSEGIVFTLAYASFRALHWLLTGQRVGVGNFSIIPGPLLGRLMALSDLWNHYAAAVFKSRVPFSTIATSRGFRYTGESKMSFVALVTHGLSAMSVFGDRIGVRLLLATVFSAALIALTIVVLAVLPAVEGKPQPAWMPYALSLILVVIFQALTLSLTLAFVILAARNGSPFIPQRDFEYFVSGSEIWHTSRHESLPLRR